MPDRQQVERDLELALLQPLGLRGRRLAFVVVDDRLAGLGGTGSYIDAVDPPGQAQLAAVELQRRKRILGLAELDLEMRRCKGAAGVGSELDVADEVDLQAPQRAA